MTLTLSSRSRLKVKVGGGELDRVVAGECGRVELTAEQQSPAASSTDYVPVLIMTSDSVAFDEDVSA